MGLFGKKSCSICGENAGGLLARKLSDGFICTKCYDKMSEWMEDKNKMSTKEVRAHLKAREENFEKLKDFNMTKAWGVKKYEKAMQFIYDEDHRWFVVVQGPEETFKERNPDIISFDQVRKVILEIDQGWTDEEDKFGTRHKGMAEFADFDEICWQYDCFLTIKVDHPYIKQIRYQMNTNTIKLTAPKISSLYTQGLGVNGKFSGEELSDLAEFMKAAENDDRGSFARLKAFADWVLDDDSFEEYKKSSKYVSAHVQRADRIQKLLGV